MKWIRAICLGVSVGLIASYEHMPVMMSAVAALLMGHAVFGKDE